MRNFYHLKSIAIAIVLVVLLSGNVFSQFANWHLNTDSSIYYNGGSVGIGVQNPNPNWTLDLSGGIHFNGELWSRNWFGVMVGEYENLTDNWKLVFDEKGWLTTGSAAYADINAAPLAINSITNQDSDFVQPFVRYWGWGENDGIGRTMDINIATPENAGDNGIVKQNDFSISWMDDNMDNTSPGLVLAPYPNSDANVGIRIDASGKIGIGIRDPKTIMDLAGDMTLRNKDIYFDTTTNAGIGWFGTSKLFSGRDMGGSPVMYGVNGGALGVRNGQTENIALRWMPDTTNNTLVIIDGKLKAREVEVKVGLWPDYVFEKNYNLMSLGELEQYINVNKHLPDVPANNTVKDQGVNVGDMQTVLLKKVEEITLYLLELKNQNDNLKKTSDELQKENDALKNRIDAIENTTK